MAGADDDMHLPATLRNASWMFPRADPAHEVTTCGLREPGADARASFKRFVNEEDLPNE